MDQKLSLNNEFKAFLPYSTLRTLYKHATLRQKTESKSIVSKCRCAYPTIAFQDLPNELILVIFSFLELKPYIISHGVCRKWQQMLPLVDIHPIRRRMFKLFHHMLQHPGFLDTRPWPLQTIQPFDRKAYIEALLSQYPAVPEEFELWILEWPARMVVFSMWPGSPFTHYQDVTKDQVHGINWLAYLPEGSPSLLTLVHRSRIHDHHSMPALLIWANNAKIMWLIFDKDEPELFGRVQVTDWNSEQAPIECRFPMPDDEHDDRYCRIFDNWLEFLQHFWDVNMRCIMYLLSKSSFQYHEHRPMAHPVPYEFGSWMANIRPSPPWVSCNEPQIQEAMQNFDYPDSDYD
ncbi:hypothetical protein D9613_003636 [Agrocybe pediades]|uniref:F-box domain-containing protein n=1 Tax=Agrocybe pediades TaxID=84607 RepID=A0A8H4QJJ3_9AGAR|nr:hypothetical protein D9613_003636 [Agrocybe pediades]